MKKKLYYRGVNIEELSRDELLAIVRVLASQNHSREKSDGRRQRLLLARLERKSA